MARDSQREPERQCEPDFGDLAKATTKALLTALARRFGLVFGRLEVRFNAGLPTGKIVIEHRTHRAVDE